MDEKIQKLNKIFSIGILVVLFFLFIQIIVGEGVYKISGVMGNPKNRSDDTRDINWVELYPFPADVSVNFDSDEAQLVASLHGKIRKIFNLYCGVLDKFEVIGEIWDAHMLKYADIAKLGYIFNACISDPGGGSGGTCVRLTNGYWTSVSDVEDIHSVEEKVKAIDELGEYLYNKNIPFLYVQSAVKNCKFDMKMPIGVEDYTNRNIDALLSGLEKEGIECIDMRQAICEDGSNHYGMFYKTDHHWNINAGFFACNVIEKLAENQFDVKFERKYNNLSMFHKKTWDNAMFGSAGQAVTHFLADSENFSVLFPNFETDFRLVIPDKNIDCKGSFEELFVDYDTLEEEINAGGGYAYETLLYGNRPLVQITNNNNKSGLKVLMVRDSSSLAVAPYMALGCAELDLIDVRLNQGKFTGSIRGYITQMQPDIVIMLVEHPINNYR